MKQEKLLTIQNMVLVAMFAAILSVLSQISLLLPGGIPITMQTFGVVLLAVILGSKLGGLTVIVYILIGICGFPVFSNFKSGIGVLFGPTGGYLVGFVLLAFIVGAGKEKNLIIRIALSLFGLVICHICGLIVYGFITHSFLPTTPIIFVKDTITAIIALVLGKGLARRITPLLTLHKTKII